MAALWNRAGLTSTSYLDASYHGERGPVSHHFPDRRACYHFYGVKAKFHYASWFGAGSELKFGLSSSLLAAN